MKWISAILQVIVALWKAFKKSPAEVAERDFQKRHIKWEQELRGLEDAEEKARQAYRIAIATGDSNHEQLLAHWRMLGSQIAAHYSAGQREGFVGKSR